MNYILGIDPGAHGALAFFDPKANDLQVYDMPTHQIRKNGALKTTIDLYQLGMLLDSWRNKVKHAIIEAPSALPKQGVTSSFNFGFACGCAQMAVAANIIPMTLVPPATWKRAMGLSSDKDEARRKASMLLPVHAKHWPLVKHDGRAEASLLAYFGKGMID